jgi:predicted ester cyclase
MTDVPRAAAERLHTTSTRALFERIYELLNEHAACHIPEVFTEDVEFRDDAWPDQIRGHAEMEHFLTSLWRAVPDLRFELLQGPYVLEDDRHVALRVRVGGTATGPYDPPGFAPTGARVTTEYGGFFELEGSRIKRGRVIVNMNEVAMQIGAAPARGSRGERLLVRLQRLNARRMRTRTKA